MKKFSFVIVAAGKGSRMGNERKQFSLLNNKPVWKWSADKAAELDDIREIVLVVPSDYDEKISCEDFLREGLIKYSSREIYALKPLCGPNYDELAIIMNSNNKLASESLSRGQKRRLIL